MMDCYWHSTGEFVCFSSEWIHMPLTLCTMDRFFFVTVMIQAKQLKDYENAVIAKRMEELDEDELLALVEEVDKDDF